jgi:Tfp pilus assembly protein PilX
MHRNPIRFATQTRTRQRGVTSLFVTLVVLLIMMVLGITAALLSGTQFRLASNLQLENVAFNVAESATVTAHSWLNSGTNAQNAGFTTYSSGSTPYLYELGHAAIDPTSSSFTWSDSTSCALNTAGVCAAVGSGGDDNKRFVIQKLAANQILPDHSTTLGEVASFECQQGDVYRITSRGATGRGTVRFVQTTVVKKIAGSVTC